MREQQILKYSEWQSGSGVWYCNDISDLLSIRAKWFIPARMLNMELDDFIKMLKEKFKVDKIHFDGTNVFYGWEEENYRYCHEFVLIINREARKRKYIV